MSENDVNGPLDSTFRHRGWTIGFRQSARSNDARTAIFFALPRVAIGNSIPLLRSAEIKSPENLILLLAQLSTFAFDFTARQSIGGENASFFIMKQLPVLPPDIYAGPCSWTTQPTTSLRNWVISRILELSYTAWDLESLASDCDYDGPPFRWNDERRFVLRCELDAAYFTLYFGSTESWSTDNLELSKLFPKPRDAVDYVLDTFSVIKRGELESLGEYRSKRLVLELYDEMAESAHTGQPFQTRLNPTPGPPADSQGNFLPIAQWDAKNWPTHIHSLRKVTS